MTNDKVAPALLLTSFRTMPESTVGINLREEHSKPMNVIWDFVSPRNANSVLMRIEKHLVEDIN